MGVYSKAGRNVSSGCWFHSLSATWGDGRFDAERRGGGALLEGGDLDVHDGVEDLEHARGNDVGGGAPRSANHRREENGASHGQFVQHLQFRM